MWYTAPNQWFMSDYSRIIESGFKAETWVCVIRHTVKWNSNSIERGTALHVPSDHLSPEPGKDNNVPWAKPTAFPQPVQWLACISYRRLFSSLNNWQRIWAALREEEELWTSLEFFGLWFHWRMTDEEKKSQNSPIMAKSLAGMFMWWSNDDGF